MQTKYLIYVYSQGYIANPDLNEGFGFTQDKSLAETFDTLKRAKECFQRMRLDNDAIFERY